LKEIELELKVNWFGRIELELNKGIAVNWNWKNGIDLSLGYNIAKGKSLMIYEYKYDITYTTAA